MSGRVVPFPPHRVIPSGRRGFTLVEILTATALTLVMMTAVVAILGSVSQSVSRSRAGLEMMDRLRATQRTLRRDLENVTVTMLPPRRPESAEGYFEYIEGPIGPVTAPAAFAVNTETGAADTSVGDVDDILLFTVRSPDVPFVGRAAALPGGTVESQEAEVAWFVRGRTLYRRVLLIAPRVLNDPAVNTNGDAYIDSLDFGAGNSFFNLYDISARPGRFGNNGNGDETSWIPNSLVDLTRRENRFAHRVHFNDGFPWNAGRWRQLGLPTLQECSDPDWMTWADNSSYPTATIPDVTTMDFWTDPHPWVDSSTSLAAVDGSTGTLINPIDLQQGPRVGEDVILTNVIGFDVKAWDPGAPALGSGGVALVPGDPGYSSALGSASVLSYGAYADLGWGPGYTAPSGAPAPYFDAAGRAKSKLKYNASSPDTNQFVYDTWSFHYEHDGVNQDGDAFTDEGTDGFDDGGIPGVVDDVGELETRPPYPHPLRGIQVKIRVFEPDGRQVREVTIVQDFLPK